MSYATLSQARDEGITTAAYGATLAADARVQRLLDEASKYIDRATGWWFEPRTKTIAFDGDGTECLWLPAPIISLTSVTVGGTALDLASIHQYGRVSDGTSLRAARLSRSASQTIWGEPVPTWPRGRRNIVVVGSFGFTEEDGTSPPAEIRDACLRLVVHNLQLATNAAAQEERQRGQVYRETTDGHSYERAGGMPGAAGSWRFGGILGLAEVDTVLARYRRPSRGARV